MDKLGCILGPAEAEKKDFTWSTTIFGRTFESRFVALTTIELTFDKGRTVQEKKYKATSTALKNRRDAETEQRWHVYY